MEEFYRIAEREGVAVKKVMVWAIEEYVERHGPGNSQTLLGSFVLGGTRSDGQVEQEIVNRLLDKSDVSYGEIVQRVRGAGVPTKGLLVAVNKIVGKLRERGVKVWQ